MAKRVLPKFNPKDDELIRENFEKLVNEHPGQYIAVANEELFIGSTREVVEKAAKKKHPRIIPSVMQIPRPESLTCAL